MWTFVHPAIVSTIRSSSIWLVAADTCIIHTPLCPQYQCTTGTLHFEHMVLVYRDLYVVLLKFSKMIFWALELSILRCPTARHKRFWVTYPWSTAKMLFFFFHLRQYWAPGRASVLSQWMVFLRAVMPGHSSVHFLLNQSVHISRLAEFCLFRFFLLRSLCSFTPFKNYTDLAQALSVLLHFPNRWCSIRHGFHLIILALMPPSPTNICHLPLSARVLFTSSIPFSKGSRC